jgi:hypothetical protein
MTADRFSKLHKTATTLGKAAALGLLFAAQTPAWAQWIHYSASGTPRTKDGTPNLEAPAPRTRAGHPDLSGIWYGADASSTIDNSQLPQDLMLEILKAAGLTAPPTQSGDDPCLKGGCITQEPFPIDGLNIGRSLPGKTLPYRPWARQLVLQKISTAVQGKVLDDPHERCAPPSYPRAFSLPQQWKIVQTPQLLLLLHEFGASYRQIFLDGRPLPVDPQPAWNGYSTGRWEKDTLVVKTAGFREGIWLDLIGSPLTEAAQVTERFRRVNFGLLEIKVSVDDPKAYTRPWTVTLHAQLVPDTELLDDICVEGVYLSNDGQGKSP